MTVEVIGGAVVRNARDWPDGSRRRRRTVRYSLRGHDGRSQRLDVTPELLKLFGDYPLPWAIPAGVG